jgi:hypothetical protein
MRFRPPLLAVLIATCGLASAFAGPASRPRLAVFAFANETGNSVYDAVCASAGRSLLLTLRQLALYDLETVPRAVGREEETLRAAAMEKGADYVMYGGVTVAKGKSLVFRFGLFDRAKGTTTVLEESEPVGALDLFEAIDEVIAQALDGITGSHIGFGRVELANGGEKGTYRVVLDGIDAGTDIKELSRVLVGTHSISVIQRRMLEESEIARASFALEEGGTYSFEFSVPFLTDAEREKIDGIERDIRSRWQSSAVATDIDAKVGEYASLLRDVSYSPRLSEYQNRAKQLQAEWEILKNRFTIETRAWNPESTLLDPSIVAYLTAQSYLDPAALKLGAESNASLLATLLELAAGKAMSEGEYERGVTLVGSVLDFARYLPEERKTEYAFAVATLKDLVAKRAEDPSKFLVNLESVFGAQMEAGKKLYTLQDKAKASGKAVVLSSDMSAVLSVAGSEGAAGPFVVDALGSVTVTVSKDGEDKVAELSIPEGRRIAFLDGGFQAFGRAEKEVASTYVGFAGVDWGTLSFNALPRQARISLNGSPAKLVWDSHTPKTGRLPPRSYQVLVRSHNMEYRTFAVVSAGQDNRVDLPYDYLSKVYKAERKSLKSVRTRKALGGLTFLAIGAAGTYLAYDAYQEGSGIYDDYENSTDPTAIEGFRDDLEELNTKAIFGGVIGGVGLLVGATMLATIPNKTKVEQSILEIDSELARLRQLQEASK